MFTFTRRASSAWLVASAALIFVSIGAASPSQGLYFRDHTFIFRRLMFQVVDAYARGELPFWDPTVGGGEPLAAYPAAQAFSPLTAIFALPGRFHDLYDLFVLARLPIALVGVYLLARTFGVSVRCALLAGVAYALGGPFVSLNNLLPALDSAAFAPFALAFAFRTFYAPRPINVAGLALTLALHVGCTDPALLFADTVIFLAVVVPDLKRTHALPLRAGALLAGVALAAGLAAVPISLTLHMLADTSRGAGFSLKAAQGFSLHPLALSNLAFPGILGDYLDVHTLFSEEDGRFYLASFYLGATLLPLVGLAVSTPLARRLAGAAVALLLLALGRFTPLHALLLEVLPPLRSSRFPVKYAVGASLAFALAIAIAADRLERAEDGGPRPRAWFFSLVAGVAPVVIGGLFLLTTDGGWLEAVPRANLTFEAALELLRGAGAQAILAGLISFGTLALLAHGRLSGASALLFVLGLTGADLALAASPLFATADVSLFEASPLASLLLADHPNPRVFRYEETSPPYIESPTHLEITRYQAQRLEPGAGSLLGLCYVLDADVNESRSRTWTRATSVFGELPDEPSRIRFLGRLGVTHLLVEANQTQIPGLVHIGQAPVDGGPPISAFRLATHRPFASLVTRLSPERDIAAVLKSMGGPLELDAASIEEANLTQIPEQTRTAMLEGTRGTTVSAALVSRTRNTLVVETRAERPTMLVVAQRAEVGWQAEVDGVRTLAPVPIDGLLSGIPLAAGKHTVRLEFVPAGLVPGVIATGLATVVMILLLFFALRRSRRA